jgi:pyruvate formate lyase activating enzyme
MKAKISNIDPMSFNDGPGIRSVIEISSDGEIELTPEETIERVRKLRPFIGPDGGGITITGSIFTNIEFVIETFHIAHKAGFSTCLRTSFLDYKNTEDLFKYVDLVIVDIKSLPLFNYNNIDEQELMNVHKCMNDLNEINKEVWIKQEIIKDKNDSFEYIRKFKKFIGMFDNISDVELISVDLQDNEMDKVIEILNGV